MNAFDFKFLDTKFSDRGRQTWEEEGAVQRDHPDSSERSACHQRNVEHVGEIASRYENFHSTAGIGSEGRHQTK